MQNVIIIGNSGFARECYWILQDVLSAKPDTGWVFKGFLTIKKYSVDLADLCNMVLGNVNDYIFHEHDVCIMSIDDNKNRKNTYEYLQNNNIGCINLVHPLAYISPSARMGEANILQRNSFIGCNVSLGSANIVEYAACISHSTCIGDGNTFQAHCVVQSRASIGGGNLFGAHSVVQTLGSMGDDNIVLPGSVIARPCGSKRLMGGAKTDDRGSLECPVTAGHPVSPLCVASDVDGVTGEDRSIHYEL